MGFEARNAILELLDQAIADKKAKVDVVAFDSTSDVVSRLEKLKKRVRVIIDDNSVTTASAGPRRTRPKARLVASPAGDRVKRQHLGKLQHNKTIAVDGTKVQAVVCGSTNLSWRGFFVQANNASSCAARGG